MSAVLRRFGKLSSSLSRGLQRHHVSSYTAFNEPVFGHNKGSSERQELEEKLKFYQSDVTNVPIVIGGEEIHTKETRYQVMPFAHQRKLAKFSYADSGLIKKAIDVSQDAYRDWEAMPLEEKSDIFLKAADLVSGKYRSDLLATTMLGQGKTIVQAEIDTACELADFFRFNVQYALDLTNWQPLNTDVSDNRLRMRGLEGFWAAIAPFNFTAISGHLPMAPALMGNVVLWKASDTSLLSSYVVLKIFQEAGVPPGVINFLPSDGPVFGDTVTNSPLLAGINFTGSVGTFHHLWSQVGKNIANYRSYPRLIGECGGKNYHFVHSSADTENVVNGTIRSAFEFGGQKCSACSRLYVPKSKWNDIREGLLRIHKDIKLGSPLEFDSFLSAVIDDKAFARIKGYIDHANSSATTKVWAGGKYNDSEGYFVEPTIVECSDPSDRLMSEEIFGPVLSVYVYSDSEYKDILKLIDSTSPYALTGAIYANDSSVLEEASDMLRHSAGNFYVNDKSTGSVVAQQPFGGARKSGTNDKAGSPTYLLKFCSPQAIKTTKVPLNEWKYSYMS